MLVQCKLMIDTETAQKAALLLTEISYVMSRYTCPITACTAAAQWGNRSHGLLLFLFSPLISLRELFWGRRGFDIKSSLQIMFFSLPGWLARDFCLLLVMLLRLLHWIFPGTFLTVLLGTLLRFMDPYPDFQKLALSSSAVRYKSLESQGSAKTADLFWAAFCVPGGQVGLVC